MGIDGTRLKEEMKGTTRIFGRKEEIQVAFSGSEARVDGDVVVLPDIEGADIDNTQASVMRGFVDHHSGVSKYADTHLIKSVSGKSSQISTILQSIEDPRIDKQRVEDYVGSRQHISDAVTAMCDSFVASQKDTDVNDEGVDWRAYVPMAIATLGRKKSGLTADLDAVKSSLPDKAIETFEKFEDRVEAADTTLKSLKLAVDIAKYLKIDIPPEVKQMAGDGGGGDERKQDPDEPVEDMGDVPYEDDPDMIPADMAAGINFNPDMSKKASREYKEFFDQDVHIPINVAVKYGMKAYRNTDVGSRLRRLSMSDYSYEPDEVPWLGDNPHNRGNNFANTILGNAAGHVGRTRIALESMLFAKLDRTWEGAKMDGRLDQKRLAAAAGGAPHVFKHRAAVNEVDAAVMILVDLSGSMGGSKEKMAAECTLLISESLNKLKVPFAVWGFNTRFELKIENVEQIPPDIRASLDPSVVSKMVGSGICSGMRHGKDNHMRLKPTSIYHYKEFSDSYIDTRPSIALIADSAGGDNHDSAAVYHSYRNLLSRSEKKRLLLVLSDGQPYCSGLPSTPQLKKMVQRIEADKSVKTLAIGICSDAPAHFYTNHAVVHELSDLPKKALIELGRMIK